MRMLFASAHCLIDLTSGAAVATLELLRALQQAGLQCAAVCASKLDAVPAGGFEQMAVDCGMGLAESGGQSAESRSEGILLAQPAEKRREEGGGWLAESGEQRAESRRERLRFLNPQLSTLIPRPTLIPRLPPPLPRCLRRSVLSVGGAPLRG